MKAFSHWVVTKRKEYSMRLILDWFGVRGSKPCKRDSNGDSIITRTHQIDYLLG